MCDTCGEALQMCKRRVHKSFYPSEEDFALSMVQSRHHHAALMDAEINLSMEEYVRGTELWSSDAE